MCPIQCRKTRFYSVSERHSHFGVQVSLCFVIGCVRHSIPLLHQVLVDVTLPVHFLQFFLGQVGHNARAKGISQHVRGCKETVPEAAIIKIQCQSERVSPITYTANTLKVHVVRTRCIIYSVEKVVRTRCIIYSVENDTEILQHCDFKISKIYNFVPPLYL